MVGMVMSCEVEVMTAEEDFKRGPSSVWHVKVLSLAHRLREKDVSAPVCLSGT